MPGHGPACMDSRRWDMELNITERAQSVVRSFMEQSEGELGPSGSPPTGGIGGPRFELTLVADSDREEDDVQVDMGDFLVLCRRDSAERLEGATVDFVERVNESGFEIRPAARAPKVSGASPGRAGHQGQRGPGRPGEPGRSAHGGEIVLVDVKGHARSSSRWPEAARDAPSPG